MNGFRRFCIAFACLGLMVPNGALRAGQTKKRVSDVSLSKGTLRGMVLDSQGKPMKGVPVRVRFAGMTIASTTTNHAGRFAVADVRSGTHQIVTPHSRLTTRLWNENAPVSAKTAAVVVNPSVVRAQEYVEGGDVYYGESGGDVYYDEGYVDDGGYYEEGGFLSGSTILGGLAIAGVVTGIVFLVDEANDGGGGGGGGPASP